MCASDFNFKFGQHCLLGFCFPASYRLLPVEHISVHGLPTLELHLQGGLLSHGDGLDLALQ